MRHYLLNNWHPLANKCYVIYQNQINFYAECLLQDGDVCINQISVENEHQLCTGNITECNPRARFSQFRQRAKKFDPHRPYPATNNVLG